jgi:hypothetical protein
VSARSHSHSAGGPFAAGRDEMAGTVRLVLTALMRGAAPAECCALCLVVCCAMYAGRAARGCGGLCSRCASAHRRVRGTLRWCCPRCRRRSLCSRSSSVARGKLRTSSSRIHSSHGWLSKRVLNMPMKPCTRGDSFAPQRAMSASAHRLRAALCTTLSLARGRPPEVGLRAQAKARWRHAGHRSAPHLLTLFSRVKP